MHTARIRLATLLLPLLAGGTALAATGTYSYTTISVPGSGTTTAVAINASGVVTGTYGPTGLSLQEYGFTYSNGVYTSIAPEGSTFTFVSGITDDGTVFGYYQVGKSQQYYGFTWKDGVLRPFGKTGYFTYFGGVSHDGKQVIGSSRVFPEPPHPRQTLFLYIDGVLKGFDEPSPSLQPVAINNAGTAIVVTDLATEFNRPVQYKDGVATLLPKSLNSNVQPSAINDADVLVGSLQNRGSAEGFIYSGGSNQVFRYKDFAFTNFYGVNNIGDVVGCGSQSSFGASEGFVLHSGIFTTLAPPDLTEACPIGINDSGQLTGSAKTVANGHAVAFLATPDAVH